MRDYIDHGSKEMVDCTDCGSKKVRDCIDGGFKKVEGYTNVRSKDEIEWWLIYLPHIPNVSYRLVDVGVIVILNNTHK